MKCLGCNIEKSSSEFSSKQKSNTGKQSRCKACVNSYNKEHYAKNKAYYLKKAKSFKDKHADEVISFVNDLKDRPCTDCKKKFPPCAMDFDHIKGKKLAPISRLVINRSLDRIKEELEKCELVCACCHRIRTNDRLKNP